MSTCINCRFGDVMSFVKTVLDPLIDRPSVHDRYVGDVTLQVRSL